MLIVIYNMILLVFFVPALALILLRESRKGGGNALDHAAERFGAVEPPPDGKPVLWMHCASLGEVRAAEPLLRRLAGWHRVLTVVTPSGRDYAEKNRVAESVGFVPLDFYPCVERFVKTLKPRALVVIETELWPGLLSAARRHGASVIVVNGRISAGSLSWYRATRSFWREVLSSISFVAARSGEDAERFRLLGLPAEKIAVTGNIKYDRDFAAGKLSREDFGFKPGDRLLTAGSVRAGEESAVIAAWTASRERHPGLKLIMVPRHAGQVPVIAGLLARAGVSHTLRSEKSPCSGDCLVVDTFGELQKLYGISDIAFVGGSLVDRGGQNPIEPAACGTPVLFGPHMDNFLSESRLLTENGGGFVVNDAATLAGTVDRLLADDALRQETGRRARAAVDGQRGALDRSRAAIESVIGKP